MKPLRSVISDWSIQLHTGDGRYHVRGFDVLHESAIRTSPVVRIWIASGVRFVETENHIYVLA